MKRNEEGQEKRIVIFTVSVFFPWQLNFIGRQFPASRQWPSLALFFSSIKFLFFRSNSSRRIPSKNKRVPPAWFLQSREKGTYVVVVVLMRAMQPSRLRGARDIRDCKRSEDAKGTSWSHLFLYIQRERENNWEKRRGEDNTPLFFQLDGNVICLLHNRLVYLISHDYSLFISDFSGTWRVSLLVSLILCLSLSHSRIY